MGMGYCWTCCGKGKVPFSINMFGDRIVWLPCPTCGTHHQPRED